MGNNVNCCATNQSSLHLGLGQKNFAEDERNNTNPNHIDNINKPLIEANSKCRNMQQHHQLEPSISSSTITGIHINTTPIASIEADVKEKFAKIQMLQVNIRRYQSKLKTLRIFNERKAALLEEMKPMYLSNIKMVAENKAEQFSSALIANDTITPFTFTDYYQQNIRRFKYTFETPYIMIGNKTVYNGSWNCNRRYHGYGTLYKSNGTKVEGLWNDGQLNGYGRFFTGENEYLIGNFREGAVNGHAAYYHNDGSWYSGEWKDDVINGKGVETFVDGATFEGEFTDGKKVNGRFSWKDGSYYKGSLCNELFDGKGVYYWGVNRVYEGQWKLGQMEGYGKLTYVDGSYYEGEFKDGLRHGKGKYYWNDKKYYDGEWVKGQQHGEGVYCKNGTITKGLWYNGQISNLSKGHSRQKRKTSKDKEKDKDKDKGTLSTPSKLQTIEVGMEDTYSDCIESDRIHNHIQNIK